MSVAAGSLRAWYLCGGDSSAAEKLRRREGLLGRADPRKHAPLLWVFGVSSALPPKP